MRFAKIYQFRKKLENRKKHLTNGTKCGIIITVKEVLK